jgi:hypothetical protein
VFRWIIIFTSLAIDVPTGMICHSFVHGLSAVLTFVIGGTRCVSQWRRLLVEIKACWSFEISSTIMTMYPIIFSLIVNLPTIMAYIAASVFFFGVITFVTVCTEVDATHERSHTGNHIGMVVVVVQVDLLLGCGFMVNDSVEILSRYHMHLISYQESLKRVYIFDSTLM